jgi:queuine/archaeosine tRNA-ribosyltransferase
MGRTMTGGANQFTQTRHMLAQEDKPIDSESTSFQFLSYAHACDFTEYMVHYCRLGIFDSSIDSRELRHRERRPISLSSQSSRSGAFA